MQGHPHDHAPTTTWLETLRRLHASPVQGMDRKLFLQVIRCLPNPAQLDALAAETHRRLRARLLIDRYRSPLASTLEIAADLIRRAPSHASARRSPSLEEIGGHLQSAYAALPAVHVEVLTACLTRTTSAAVTARILGISDFLLHRYHTQARALLRCHPWSVSAGGTIDDQGR